MGIGDFRARMFRHVRACSNNKKPRNTQRQNSGVLRGDFLFCRSRVRSVQVIVSPSYFSALTGQVCERCFFGLTDASSFVGSTSGFSIRTT